MFKNRHRAQHGPILSMAPKCSHVLLAPAVLAEVRGVSLAFTHLFLQLPLPWWPLWKLFLSQWKSIAMYKTMRSWVFPEKTESAAASGGQDQACAKESQSSHCSCLFRTHPYHPTTPPCHAAFHRFTDWLGTFEHRQHPQRESALLPCSGQGCWEQAAPGVSSKVEDRKSRR